MMTQYYGDVLGQIRSFLSDLTTVLGLDERTQEQKEERARQVQREILRDTKPTVADEGEGPPPIGLPEVDPTRDGIITEKQPIAARRPTPPPRETPRRNNNRDDDDDDKENLNRRILEGAARGEDVDKDKDQYRRLHGNPCVWVGGVVVCSH